MKRGRPKKVVLAAQENLSIAQLAFVQIDLTNKVNMLSNSINNLAQGLNSIVEQENRVTMDLAKKIQALECRVDELDKLILSKPQKGEAGSSIN